MTVVDEYTGFPGGMRLTLSKFWRVRYHIDANVADYRYVSRPCAPADARMRCRYCPTWSRYAVDRRSALEPRAVADASSPVTSTLLSEQPDCRRTPASLVCVKVHYRYRRGLL